jgi:hypothetical protein
MRPCHLSRRLFIVLATSVFATAPLSLFAQPLIEAEFYLDNGALGAASSSGNFDDRGLPSDSKRRAATNTLVITRFDVESGTTVLDEALNVSSAADFLAYSRSVLQEDENVTKIEAADDEVSLWYRMPARFFGVIPSEVSAKISVLKNGAIIVEHPWWHGFFYTKDAGTSVENDLSNTAGTIARADTGEVFSSNTKARLVNALHSVIKAHVGPNNKDVGTES